LKIYPTEALRNVGIVGHSNAGKTSLTEALLFEAGAIERMGRVDEGTTVADFEDEEIRRQVSIGSTLCALEYADTKINLIDCPGYADFVAEVVLPMRVVDGAVIVVDAASGIGVGTERAWRLADENGVSRMIFINRLDKDNTDFEQTLASVRESLSHSAVPLSLPIGGAGALRGVVDLLTMKAYIGEGRAVAASEIPDEMAAAAASAREKLVEEVAASDEALMEKYLEEGDLTQDELASGLLAGVTAGKIVPVLAGSATTSVGVGLLLGAIRNLLPAPRVVEFSGIKPGTEGHEGGPEVVTRTVSVESPTTVLAYRSMMHPYQGKLVFVRVLSGRIRQDMTLLNASRGHKEKLGEVFTTRGKTQEKLGEAFAGDIVGIAKIHQTHTCDTLCDVGHPIVVAPPKVPEPMFSASLTCKERSEVDKMAAGLGRISEEDVAFRFFRDAETDESIISGIGRLHLEVVLSKLRNATGVEAEMGKPKIPYRETIRVGCQIHHRYKKQTGGRGQFGDVHLRLEALPRGTGFEFVDKVVGGAIPRQYIPAVEKGVVEALSRGVLAGCPVVDIRVELFDGQYHSVDSSEFAFKRAAAMGFRKGMEQCQPILLEPIVKIQVTAPDENMGDIMGDLTGRRGRPQGIERQGQNQVINATAPLSEVATYEADLRSMTGGRASFTMEPSHYEEVPAHLIEAICAEYKRVAEEEE
jgi:elongation factor G